MVDHPSLPALFAPTGASRVTGLSKTIRDQTIILTPDSVEILVNADALAVALFEKRLRVLSPMLLLSTLVVHRVRAPVDRFRARFAEAAG